MKANTTVSQDSRNRRHTLKNVKLLDLLRNEDLLKNMRIDCKVSDSLYHSYEANCFPDIHCICGESMERLTSIQLPYSNCYCDFCRNTKPMKIIYHCPKNELDKIHPDGYDICERCVGLQIRFMDEHDDLLDVMKSNGEMLELTLRWLKLKYLLRKFERNWEPKAKKIFTHLFAQYNNINNIYLPTDYMRSVQKSTLRKYILKLEKKFNCITFYDRINSLNKSHCLVDINHMNSLQKNKWKSQQIKKKNSYKTYAHNVNKYKKSRKQKIFKLKTKPTLKKKRRLSLNDSITYNDETKKLVRLQKNIKMKQIGSCNVTDVVEINIISYPPIHYPLQLLWSLKQDFLLGQQVELTYWNTKSVRLKGTLVCISNCGQFEVGQISDYNYEPQYLTTDTYWFHVNCIKSIFLVNEMTELKHMLNGRRDIRNLIIDMIKIKLINYFLFICSFKTDESETLSVNNSPIKYLIKRDLDVQHKYELQAIKDSDIIHCPFAIQMSSQFIYGAKQKDFEYLKKCVWKDDPKYFTHEQILTLLCSYKDSLVQYIQMKESQEREMRRKKKYDVNVDDMCVSDQEKEIKKTKERKLVYIDWDTSNVKKQMKVIKEEDRTV